MPSLPNKLLASLSSGEYGRIATRLQSLNLSNGSVLPHCGRARVYFPGSGACSVLSRMSDGTTIEVASVGNEGGVGLPAVGSQFTQCSYVQVAHGALQYMAMSTFEQLSSNSEFGEVVERYSAEFMRSVMQLVACNRMHTIDARCARWILLTHERVRRARFELTQPFLAMAIGATAEDLSRVMAHLIEAGIVKHDGASMTILDPIALHRVSCRCYDAFKASIETPLAPPHSTADARAVPGAGTRDNVVAMRGLPVCTVCGLARNAPHKMFDECLRAIDAELRAATERARELVLRRSTIARESLEKYEKFLDRRRS